jgi:hypothetical protein
MTQLKHLLPIFLIIPVLSSRAQGGWIKDTNPLNDAVTYTTTYPYVGASFIELNGDGLIDIFAPPVNMFINNGNGTFSEIIPLQFSPTLAVAGSSSADLDNDGDNDIIVASVPSRVFFNDGTGSFSDSSLQVPTFVNYGSWGVAISDYNNDRNLDFIFAYADGLLPGSIPSPCHFYQQQTGAFNPVNISLYPLTDSLNTYTNPYWSDYDLDGDMDLFMASGPGTGTPQMDLCYKNLKMETGVDSFTTMTTELFATDLQDGSCYNFIDYDNDKDLDLCVTNNSGAPTKLYRNDYGTYTDISVAFTNTATNMANCWGDYDNDGDLDVILTNRNQVSKYYRNDGGSFTYLSMGFSTETATNGIANGDYDNDGDLDIFTNGIGNNGSTNSVGLYINDTVAANRNFVNIELVGTTSNRSAIGAIVKLKATINGAPVWQLREVNAQNTMQGQNDLRVHFGLGNASSIDSVNIIWPSGTNEFYTGQQVNSFYRITEGTGSVNLSMESNDLDKGFKVFPNPTEDLIQIETSQTGKDESINYEVTDMYGNILINQSSKGNITVSMSSFSSGVYFIRVHNHGYTMVKKIIRQ